MKPEFSTPSTEPARYGRLLLLAASLLLLGGCGEPRAEAECDGPPCEPDQALGTFELVEGFQIELFAAEPLLRDPVAMEVDEKGRIYIAEDPGYPEMRDLYGAIRLLEDTTGDGYPDESRIFADELRAPRGIISWNGGILVTDAPDILFLKDTNGDGTADHREVVMSGFVNTNPQLGINTPVYGLDNWIYFAHRTGSSRPHFAEEADEEHPVAGSGNIRIRPDERRWESLAVSSQFGHTFDAFGRHLQTLHNDHISQEVISHNYLNRNPDLVVAESEVSIAEHGGWANVFPITEEVRHELFTDVGVFTAACGITCYLGGAFPDEYDGVSFVAEPAHNLIHADRLIDDGIVLKAQRMFEDRDFLASTDRWFRPVQMYIGPDGALYVLDYYREVIEQPRFLSEEVMESGILYDGDDRGRIWRITPDGSDGPDWVNRLDLDEASADQLVEQMNSENIWWRRITQKQLVQEGVQEAVEPLRELATGSAAPNIRLHALWTLDGLGAIQPEEILQALDDDSAGLREQGLILAERHLEQSPDLQRKLLAMADLEPSARTRFQLLLTLGTLESDESREVRTRMLHDQIEEPWMQLAFVTANDLDYRELLETSYAEWAGRENEALTVWFDRLGMLIGARQSSDDLAWLIDLVTDQVPSPENHWWASATLQGLGTGLHRSDYRGEEADLVRDATGQLALHPDAPDFRRSAIEVLSILGAPEGEVGNRLFEQAAEIAEDTDMETELRADALRVIRLGDVSPHRQWLVGLLSPEVPGAIQAEAARTLGEIGGASVGEELLARWPEMTPQVRLAATETLVNDDERIALLLDAVESGDVQRSTLSLQQVTRLMLNPDDELRLRAQNLLGLPDEPRSEVIDRYLAAVDMEGNPERGREVYDRACAMCHQIDGENGVYYGPDLATVRNDQARNVIADILNPNAEITAGYEQWQIERTDGTRAYGIIASESANAITLRDPAGQETTIPRAEISTMQAMQESAMPTGLEQQISVEEMADLLEYLGVR